MRNFGIILTCGRGHISSQTILPIIAELDDYIVVNNGNSDMTILWLAQNKVKHVALPVNMGISAAQRIALEFAQPDDLIFTIDDDLIIPTGTIKAMADVAARYPSNYAFAPVNDSISPDCKPTILEDTDEIEFTTHVSALRCYDYSVASKLFNIQRDINRFEYLRNNGGKCGYIKALHIQEMDIERRPADQYIF